MKREQIKERCVYEVAVGKSPTGEVKKAIVKAMQYNVKTNSWTCRTENGKQCFGNTAKIKDPKRFLKEIAGPKVAENAAVAANARVKPRKGPEPKERPKENVPKVSKEEAERLLENVRKAAWKEKIMTEALSLGFALDEDKMFQISQALWDAKQAADDAGVTLNNHGRSNGMMSGKDAAYRLLQEEGRPMWAREICDLAHERGYCDMPGFSYAFHKMSHCLRDASTTYSRKTQKTPWATIASTITVDINANGKHSRFKKVGPGLFAANEKQE